MNRFQTMLLTLTDEAFFELMRNYLGEIKTPFNKHDLIERLTTFLKRADTQERIAELIDRNDAEVLTMIWLLEEPTHERLFDVLAPGRSYLELHRHLVNLEDRLLIYRDADRVRFVPYLRQFLEANVFSVDLLFPSVAVAGESREEPWLTDSLIASLFAFFRETASPLKSDGGLRKRTAEQLAQCVPALAGNTRRRDAALRVLHYLGILGQPGDAPDSGSAGSEPPPPDLLRSLERLSPEARTCAYWAAAVCETPGQVGNIQHGLLELAMAVPQTRALSRPGMERLTRLVTAGREIEPSRLLDALLALGGIVETGEHMELHLLPVRREATGTAPVVVQPNLEITVSSKATFRDIVLVASVARLVRHDRYPHFELTKESVARALEDGVSEETLANRLTELAGSIPQNVRVSLTTWAQEFSSVRLRRGVVMTVSPERRALVEHAQSVSSLVQEVLAPGVYLVHEHDVEALGAALRESGVEVPPRLNPARPREPQLPAFALGSAFQLGNRLATLGDRGYSGSSTPTEDPAAEFAERLERLSVSAEQRRELEERIGRKLILFPNQLRPGAIRDRKTEAKGLDYVGKVRLIEQAVRSTGMFLEVMERRPDGSPAKHLVRAQSLDRRGNQLYLVARAIPDETEVTIPVSKIALVRALRETLYNR